ncbi:MAG: lactonase family protein [Acidobacteriota bacterium]
MRIGVLLVAGAMMGQTVYVGTRTREGRSDGIYRLEFDGKTGAMTAPVRAVETPDPTFLAVHPSEGWVYAVAALPEGELRAFRREEDGSLKLLNRVSSRGAGPAHVTIDRTGKFVATANYGSGSVAVFRIERDGRLSEAVAAVQHEGKGPNESRQAGPHAHSCYFSPDNRRLYCADLGLDEVKIYGFDGGTGSLRVEGSLRTPAGAGPRHLAFGGKRIYVLNEMGSSVSVFEEGVLRETVSALPAGFAGESTAAEIVLHPNGRFLYASNRGADTIAVFRGGERLVKTGDVAVGRTPRNFVLSPDGRFMLVGSQAEDKIETFRVDGRTGALKPAGGLAKTGAPICLRFVPRKEKRS